MQHYGVYVCMEWERCTAVARWWLDDELSIHSANERIHLILTHFNRDIRYLSRTFAHCKSS